MALPGFAQSRIVLTNNKILQGPEIADHALGLLLALTLTRVAAGRAHHRAPQDARSAVEVEAFCSTHRFRG